MTQRTGLIPGTTQTAAYTATAARTSATVKPGGNGHVHVRLLSTTDCHVVFGAGSPDATTGDMPLSAGVAEVFLCQADYKVSAIRQTADGTLYVTTCRSGADG
jgi:hypothetical protein